MKLLLMIFIFCLTMNSKSHNKARWQEPALFKETKTLFETQKTFGQNLLNILPKHPFKPEILLSLGINSRDYDNTELTAQYHLDSKKLPDTISISTRPTSLNYSLSEV